MSLVHWLSRCLKCLCVGALLSSTGVAGATPVVFWASDPIAPGQTALLFGDGIGKSVQAEGARVPDLPVQAPARAPEFAGGMQALEVLQASDLSAKVALPAQWKLGLYALRLKGGRITYLNRAEPWWWIGGSADAMRGAPGDVALAGETIRVFGKNFGAQTRAWLTARQETFALQAVKAEKYAATFRLPAGIAPGEYALWVHNGYGGAYGFGAPLRVQVGMPASWPVERFNVRDFGAHGDDVADDTAAFLAAIARAQQNGGGIVFVPAGHYKITARLALPPRTVLRGERPEAVWLYVPKAQPEFDTLIAGNGDFAVENLSIVAQTVRRLIICPDEPGMTAQLGNGFTRKPGANVHLSHLRLQLLRYAHRTRANEARRAETQGPSAISLDGPDMWLQDVAITSSGMPIDIQYARRCRIENCVLGTGRSGWYGIYNFEEGIFEGNDIHAVDLEGSGGGVQGNANHLYFANNHWHDTYGNEREALTFDTPYYSAWMGMPASSNGATFAVPGQQWAPDSLRGQTCLVVNGKGLGQNIPIAANTADTVTLQSPWTIPLDQTSVVSIQSNKQRVVIYNNQMSDASVACQLFSQCYGFILDGNRAERTGGLYANSWDSYDERRQKRHYSCSYFNQWLNNQVTQSFVYEQGGFNHGEIGPRIEQNGLDTALTPPHVVLALGNILRDNRAADDTMIGEFYFRPMSVSKKFDLDYVGRDTLIEGNTIVDAPVGVEVARFFIDTLVRNNKTERCRNPINNHGTGTLIRQE